MPRKYIRRGRGLSRQAQRIIDYLRTHGEGTTPDIAIASGQTQQAAYRTMEHYDLVFEPVGEATRKAGRGLTTCNVWALKEAA